MDDVDGKKEGVLLLLMECVNLLQSTASRNDPSNKETNMNM